MRTTLTLDPDVALELQRITRERGISFKEAVNLTLRQGLVKPARARRYRLPTQPMGLRPGIDLDRAMHLAAVMEDEETVHKLEMRK